MPPGARYRATPSSAARYAIRVAVGGVTTGREHVDALWDLLRATADPCTPPVTAPPSGAG